MPNTNMFSGITEPDPPVHKQWRNIPFCSRAGTSHRNCELEEKKKKHRCNRNMEMRTSRNVSRQLSSDVGRLTAIVTQACGNFFFFFFSLFHDTTSLLDSIDYLVDLCVPAGQEMLGSALFP